jgi:hypothetical protein
MGWYRTSPELRDQRSVRRVARARIDENAKPVGLDTEGMQAHQVHAVGIDEVRHEPRLGGNIFRRRLGEEVDRERHHELDYSRDADVADHPGRLAEATPAVAMF